MKVWTTHPIRGNDNDMAAFGMVRVFAKGGINYIQVDNQFLWTCILEFDAAGSPAYMRDCKSRDKGWWTSTKSIELSCTLRKKDELCRGTYRLRAESDLLDEPADFLISRALDRNAQWPW